jgi:hypothetical protein
MRIIRTEIEISASAERVWETLCGEPRNLACQGGHILDVRGSLVEGGVLALTLRVAQGIKTRVDAKLLKVDPPHEIRWRGKLAIPGLFQGEHVFQIVEREGDGVTLIQWEIFSGILAPLLLATLLRGVKSGFQEMNRGIKEHAGG